MSKVGQELKHLRNKARMKMPRTSRIEVVDKPDVEVEHRVCKFQLDARIWHRPKKKPELRSVENYSGKKKFATKNVSKPHV
jgi:hypothetical protein